jgi:CheY-like chemotaxis protein
VVAARNAMEGLRLASELMPAVMTLDVNMPGGDGWETLAALKRHPLLASIPVVMLTISDDRQHALALGADALLTKPVDADQLRALLARYLPAHVLGAEAAADAA